MCDLVDIVIPAAAQSAAEMLGLKVSRSAMTGIRVRRIPRDDAEIARRVSARCGIDHEQPAT
jgi:hypothetical protein